MARMRPEWNAVALLGASACVADRGMPRDALRVVDCDDLPAASAAVVDQVEAGETVLTDAQVASGAGQAILSIRDEGGASWYAPPGRTDTSGVTSAWDDGGPYWCV